MRIVSQRAQQLARRYISNTKTSRSVASCSIIASDNLIHNHLTTTRGAANSNYSNDKSLRSFSTQATPEFLREHGIFCEDNLLKFNTLHELQKRSSIAFAENPIFGTYTDVDGDPRFEYMNYREFGEKVDQCRTVLKDLGESNERS